MSKTDELLRQKHLNDLKKEAVKMSQKGYMNIEDLWSAMERVAENTPVIATVMPGIEEKEFVVEQGASYRQIAQAYAEQVCDIDDKWNLNDTLIQLEHLEKLPPEPNGKSYAEMAEANLVLNAVKKSPEDAKKISTLQLMGAYNYFAGLNNDAAAVIQPVLDKSVEKYLNGKETFPTTLQNYERIRLLHGYMFHNGQCDEKQSDKLLHDAEEKILKDPDMLDFATNHDLHVAYLLARKHEKDDVLGEITQKISKEKAISGNAKS